MEYLLSPLAKRAPLVSASTAGYKEQDWHLPSMLVFLNELYEKAPFPIQVHR